MKCNFLTLILGLALAVTNPAMATVKIATWKGMLTSGYDITGVFGQPFASLDGLAYTARYTYDTSLGTRSTVAQITDQLVGGSQLGIPSVPITDASITIKGNSAKLSANFFALASNSPNVRYISHNVSQIDNYLGVFFVMYNQGYSDNIPTNLELDFAPLFFNNGGGHFTLYVISNNIYKVGAYGQMSSTGTVQVGSIPEASTWTMLIMGFGLAGAIMRSRRATARPA